MNFLAPRYKQHYANVCIRINAIHFLIDCFFGSEPENSMCNTIYIHTQIKPYPTPIAIGLKCSLIPVENKTAGAVYAFEYVILICIN